MKAYRRKIIVSMTEEIKNLIISVIIETLILLVFTFPDHHMILRHFILKPLLKSAVNPILSLLYSIYDR